MKKLINYLLLLFVALIWGSTFVVLKDTVQSVSPFTLITYRFALASLLLGFWVLIKKYNILINWKIGLISGFFQFMTFAPQTIGLQTTSASNSAFITGLFIVFVPLINFIFFRSKPKKIEIFAVVLSVTGLWILTGGIGNLIKGDLITIITAVSIAVVIVLSNISLKKGTNSIILTFQQLSVTALFGLLLGLFTKEDFIVGSINNLIPIIYLAIFASFICFALQNYIMKTVKPEIVSIIVGTEPVFALLIAWLFSYERYNGVKLIGGIIMFLAIILPEVFNLINERVSNKKYIK